MRSTERKTRRHSLTTQFSALLCLAGLASAALFLTLQIGGGMLLNLYLDTSDFETRYIEKKLRSLQDYVTQHHLSTQDTGALSGWLEKNPLVLVELYRANRLIYTSLAPEESGENREEAPYYDWVTYYSLSFSDGEVQAVLYTAESYQWFAGLMIVSLLLSALLFLLVFLLGSRRMVDYICRLSGQIQAMEGGDLDQPILVEGNNELSRLAQGLDAMRLSFREQRRRESALFRANQTMITQMSHDLRTPLTALQIYTDILRYRKFEDDRQAELYLSRIDAKVSQIKQLSEHIFQYSLISGEQPVRLEPPRPAREVFHDALSELTGYLEQQGFSCVPALCWPEAGIEVSTPYINRLLDNVGSNLLKYADPSSPVRVGLRTEGEALLLTFCNAVRPDRARRDSSGVGLSNMEAMMSKMGGRLLVESTPEEFRVTLAFPLADQGA
ncbi:HAMP domain-containing sensor histidine kinase [Pseudoflavonifractor phocaeensis]|uniref:HAMP domain-containing sensor histidine kinase n=1 Tax=Pseudoflavonifractor phocaeensis TaxID=1870988 RepID=UPI00195F2189|nr:HAMP domain-containing sensor histidine kinase [Pseudoflavonifractor phocaeensis]